MEINHGWSHTTTWFCPFETDDMGSVWHIRLRISSESSTELLLKPLFTKYIAHKTCTSFTIPSKNGKWTVCITVIPEEQMMK